MHHNPFISRSVYIGMCHDVGTPTEVRFRREVMDIDEAVSIPVGTIRGLHGMISGSRCEGFKVKSSDIDFLYWFPDFKVICDLSQISFDCIPKYKVILMECKYLPPGFTRLKMMTPSGMEKWNSFAIREVYSSFITINNEIYISSFLFRTQCLNYRNTRCNSMQHGPCITYNSRGGEVGNVLCFRSDQWPNVALPWVRRCHLKSWPQNNVLSSIIKNGCHVVPISSSPFSPENDCEWRISFSRAEKILVYSMNHCQFLCYGMLKIFFKEAIKDSCLCSYFMKTVVFWVIQNNNHLTWVPENLLVCFWTCFKLLISWVYRGECPNFFIPQNNMFRVKVVGQTQVALFDHLLGLYCKGISCLLLSPTIDKCMKVPILNRPLEFITDEDSIISSVSLSMYLFFELTPFCEHRPRNEKEFVALFSLMEQLLNLRLSSFQRLSVQLNLCKQLKNCSWFLSEQFKGAKSNKRWIHFYNKSLKMMKLASKIGCASDVLYLALLYHKNCQYEQSLGCLRKAEISISKPDVIYGSNHYVNEEINQNVMAGMSLKDIVRKCLIHDIILYNEYVYIDELVRVQNADTNSAGYLIIPPSVMLHMLFILNHHRLGDTVKSQQSLQDLQTQLCHVPEHLRKISWQILGICGDYVGALNSFTCSLQN